MNEFITTKPEEVSLDKYTVIRDTREKKKKGWYFKKSSICNGTIDQKMDEGDYTLVGYEKSLCIERKGVITEFAQNITQPRFFKELNRMNHYEFPFLVLEFTMDDVINYPHNLRLPDKIKKKIRLSGSYILRMINEIQLDYKTKVILCGDYGLETVTSIFKRIIERDEKR